MIKQAIFCFFSVVTSTTVFATDPNDVTNGNQPGGCRVCGTVIVVDPRGDATIFHDKKVVAVGSKIKIVKRDAAALAATAPRPTVPIAADVCTQNKCVRTKAVLHASDKLAILEVPAAEFDSTTVLRPLKLTSKPQPKKPGKH